MRNTARLSDSLGARSRMSERRLGTTGWFCNHGFLLAMVLITLLTAMSGCGSGQTDVGQTTGNNVPVNLNISMPQESAAASTSGSRIWATVQSWLPSLSSAWAATTRDLRTLTVQVTGPGILSPITSQPIPLSAPTSGQTVTAEVEVPVGPDRVFIAHGFDAAGREIFKGESTSTTLTVGQAASVDVILIDITTGAVTGTVTNVGTGTPLPNATMAAAGTSLRTTTNSNGNFTLNGVPEGRQTLTVSAAGFTSTTQAVTVVAGTSISAGTIALTPLPTTGAVTGTVTNARAGTPLPDATVAVAGTSLRTTTNSNGNFTLNGVPEGRQTLTVSAAGFTSTTQAVTVVAGTSVSAGTIALTPLPTTGTVIGTVTNAGTGATLSNATVTVTGTSLRTTTNSDGNFTLPGVPQGRQTLTISASGFTATTRDVTVAAGQSISAGTIALTPIQTTGSITGGVINATTQAAFQGATVTVQGLSLATTTNSDGIFELTSVPAGQQTVRVSAPLFTSTTRTVEVPAGGSVDIGTIAFAPITDWSGAYFGTEVRSNEDRIPIKIVIQQTANIASVSIFYLTSFGFPDIPQLAGSTEVANDRFSITFRQSLGNDVVFIDTWSFSGRPPSVLQFTRNLINNPNGFHRSTGFLRPG